MAATSSPQLHLANSPPVVAPDDEGTLVGRAKGDKQAFAELYRRYVDVVYRYCYHRLDSQAAAEDATSEIFVKAFTGIGRFRESSSFRSWLFSIAHNTVTDHYRRRRPDLALDAAALHLDPAPGPEDQAEFSDAARSVAALLSELTEQQASIIELRLAGLTGPEIADVLGCSLASVKIGQVRGYSRLRDILVARATPRGGDRDR